MGGVIGLFGEEFCAAFSWEKLTIKRSFFFLNEIDSQPD